jgi:hypothetical protein
MLFNFSFVHEGLRVTERLLAFSCNTKERWIKMKVDKSKLVVHMDRGELEDAVFYYSRATNDILYKGLASHLFDIDDQLKLILTELDYIKAYIALDAKRGKRNANKKNEAVEE